MNPRLPARPPDTVALLTALDDGRIIVAPDGTLPTAELPPGHKPSALAQCLAHRLGLACAPPRPAVTDTVAGPDGTTSHHMIVWSGPAPAPRQVPAPYSALPIGQFLATLPHPAAARLRTACRAGLLSDTIRLADGRRPGVLPSKAERTRARFTWHPAIQAPTELEVRQVWGWLTDRDGRVLILLDRLGTPSLPGGRPEPGEALAQTLAREAAEEAAADIGPPTVLGLLVDLTGSFTPAWALLFLLTAVALTVTAVAERRTC
jgi:hypothetical protein